RAHGTDIILEYGHRLFIGPVVQLDTQVVIHCVLNRLRREEIMTQHIDSCDHEWGRLDGLLQILTDKRPGRSRRKPGFPDAVRPKEDVEIGRHCFVEGEFAVGFGLQVLLGQDVWESLIDGITDVEAVTRVSTIFITVLNALLGCGSFHVGNADLNAWVGKRAGVLAGRVLPLASFYE
ncbi:MAG: hypothetical protein Q9210_007221, partial [Variospora velana]